MWREFQSYLFEKIKSQLPPNVSLAKELMGVLEVSEANLYKKIRGDVALTGDEALTLLQHFGVSADAHALSNRGLFTSEHSALSHPVRSPEDYLENLLLRMRRIATLPQPFIWYATYEIPVFYYIFYPELIAFKLYVWGRVNWQLPELSGRSFDVEDFYQLYPRLETLRQELATLMAQVPSREFWPVHILDNTLSQVRIKTLSGRFSTPAAASQVCDRLREMLLHFEKMAVAGYKMVPGSDTPGGVFELYLNELIYTNNTILIRSAERSVAVYAAFDTPNFVQTTDPSVLQHIDNWMLQLRTRTMRVSVENEHQRAYLFRQLHKRLQEMRAEIGV